MRRTDMKVEHQLLVEIRRLIHASDPDYLWISRRF